MPKAEAKLRREHSVFNLSCAVNGAGVKQSIASSRTLLEFIREDLGLKGTKEGCGEGECGACTVLLDGKAVTSCLVPVCQVQGRKVETVESLGRPGRLGPLQKSFQENAGAQCGFCTPGILMTASRLKRPDQDAAVRAGLAGHLCRCTGYMHIVESVTRAPARRKR